MKKKIAMKHFIIPFALLALMTSCGGNNNGKSQENVEQNIKVMYATCTKAQGRYVSASTPALSTVT